MDGINDLAYAFMSGYSASSGGGGSGGSGSNSWGPAHDFTTKLNAIQWGGCDGPVAVDLHEMLNKAIVGYTGSTLDARTRDTGRYTETSGTYTVDSQDGCLESPRYDVTWSIGRTSWKAP
jgi:hypothetical protein